MDILELKKKITEMNLVDEFNTDEERIGQIEDQSEKIIQNKS